MASSYLVQSFLTEYGKNIARVKSKVIQPQPTNYQHVPAKMEIPIWRA
jgi:hypothetical protein